MLIAMLLQIGIEEWAPDVFEDCLNSWDGYEEDLKSGFRRRPQKHFQFVLNISSSLVRIKLHTNNQSPSLLNSEDGYEEDLKIRIWKMTSTTFPIVS